MDIFDLPIEEFEKQIDDLLANISEEELLRELIENGLVVDEYKNESYYINEVYNNIWVHKNESRGIERMFNILIKKEERDVLEAA